MDYREALLIEGFRLLTERRKQAVLAFTGKLAEIEREAEVNPGGPTGLRLVIDNERGR